jgi:hypothetical protein
MIYLENLYFNRILYTVFYISSLNNSHLFVTSKSVGVIQFALLLQSELVSNRHTLFSHLYFYNALKCDSCSDLSFFEIPAANIVILCSESHVMQTFVTSNRDHLKKIYRKKLRLT